MFNKKNWDKPFSEKVAKRVAKIATPDLLPWADQAVSEINRCLSGYQRTNESWYMDEALLGAEALHAVIDEYNRRMLQ
jgi:hypothetical protein